MKIRLNQISKTLIKYTGFFISLFLLSISIQKCSSIDQYRSQTTIFNKYLHIFGQEISKKDQLYIIYSNIACNGCVSLASQVIIENVDLINKTNSTIIYAKDEYIPKILLNHANCIFDKDAEIEYINLDIYNVTLIETKNRKINRILSLTPQKENEFIEFISSYYSYAE